MQDLNSIYRSRKIESLPTMNENEKKRLLYRANYRGFREADILLGGFLKENIHSLSNDDLNDFENLLEARDHDIYDWITGKQTVPSKYDTPILKKIRQYRPDF